MGHQLYHNNRKGRIMNMKYEISAQEQEWARQVWDKLEKKISAQNERLGSKMPYIPVDGRYEDMGEEHLTWWTNSFWSGILWQTYHATGKQCYADNAVAAEARLDRALEEYTGLDHDIGFLWLHTAVADYRLTGNEKSKLRGVRAASVLASRFQPAGNYFRAWNHGEDSVAIIDCLMNLPILYWASEATGDSAWKMLAMAHADMALREILRPDGSSNHIVAFDRETGEVTRKPGGQGYGEGSSWTRGQAWAIYGMALSYRHTGKQEYLDASKRTAHYFLANAALMDYDVVIDFRAPAEPVYYDNTAAACAACGLLELSEHVPEPEKPLYIKSAVKLLQRLTEGFCNWETEEDGITMKGSARYDRESDREVPIIYGDYFLVEGILRLLGKEFLIW